MSTQELWPFRCSVLTQCFKISVFLFFILFSACSSVRYRYVPIENKTNAVTERNRIIYNEPKESPTGTVRLTSLGVSGLVPQEGAEKVQALHIRMIISNQGTSPWILNSQEQQIAFSNQVVDRPVLVQSNGSQTSDIKISQNEMRAIDLFFQLPPTMNSEDKLPEFDLHWKIQAGNLAISETTPFDRVKSEAWPPLAYYPYDFYGTGAYPPGWGPAVGPYGWWGA